MVVIPCPEVAQLRRLLRGELIDAERATVAAHLESCTACLDTLEHLTDVAVCCWAPEFRSTMSSSVTCDPCARAQYTSRKISGYAIQGELGRGAQSIVMRAIREDTGRPVALKLLRTWSFPDAQRRQRFLREAAILLQLNHPGIVRMDAAGVHGNQPWLSMELLNGGTLADRLRHSRCSHLQATRIAVSLAEAMAYAHDNLVLHCDLKPSNVFFSRPTTARGAWSEPEELKIGDFSLAQVHCSHAFAGRMTGVVGTPSYMAPELTWGLKMPTATADIYALGAILYSLLTGVPPHLGETPFETLVMARTVPPPAPSAVRPGIPAALERVCLRCLAKNPRERYASAQALARELQTVLEILKDSN